MFFDTYALIEIAKGAENYKKYLKEEIVTTKLNLIEMYYAILRDFDEEKAKKHFYFYLPFVREIQDETIFEALKFRLIHRNLSYADCIGYTMAKKIGTKFLTGDREFEKLENVEYVR
ncbi:MAG: PIN domain-containing protein [Candidatus Thermoplasmatota archaeon]